MTWRVSFCVPYIVPEGSNFYHGKDNDIWKVSNEHTGYDIVIAGDLNERPGTAKDYIVYMVYDNVKYILGLESPNLIPN